MLVKKNRGRKKKYVYGGAGIIDSLMNVITSNAAKEVATNLAKNAATSAGTKLTEKAINKLIPKSKQLVPKTKDLTPKSKDLSPEAQKILSKYKAVKIQDYVKGSGLKII